MANKIDIRRIFENAHVVAVDMDKTLCREECWTEQEVLNATPQQDVIDVVNRLYHKKFIVIYTARRYALSENTLKWLDRHGVLYNAISFRKTATDVYIEDKAIRPDELVDVLGGDS